jgi:CysZ protein
MDQPTNLATKSLLITALETWRLPYCDRSALFKKSERGWRTTMLDAVIKALSQMFSPPFRALLLKAMGLALVLVVLVGIGVHRLLVWLASLGENWAESVLGATAHAPLAMLAWILSVAAGLGIILGSVFLMPAVTALVGSFFVDDIALAVERHHYPDEPVGTPLPLLRAILEGGKTALLAVVVYLIAVPSLLIAGLGAIIFFIATAYLLGREYFELAAMRYRSAAQAKMLRKRNQGAVFIAGMFIAAFVSIPIVSLATPLFAMALMVHMHKRTMIGGQPTIGDGARLLS